jgi:glycosyltransferase involved in cell wall biosynthesis
MLSICVIGRNEAEDLPRLIDSLRGLKDLPFEVETIFVDSASSDGTVDVARKFFDKVYVLEESKNLCAAAGRHLGTVHAKGDWVLYLDGDMALRPEFTPILERVCAAPGQQTGWIGQYWDIYDTGMTRKNAMGHGKEGKIVTYFGGAVLLPRRVVFQVGNWNPGVFSNEEIDLYTRLRGTGCVVKFANVPMIEHFTEKLPKWRVLLEHFVPGKYLGKKFYGFGQVLAARIKDRQLFNLIRYFPYPFVYWASIMAAVVFLAMRMISPAILILLAGSSYVWIVRGPRFIALYSTFLVQGILGYGRFDPGYTPKLKTVLNKSPGS